MFHIDGFLAATLQTRQRRNSICPVCTWLASNLNKRFGVVTVVTQVVDTCLLANYVLCMSSPLSFLPRKLAKASGRTPQNDARTFHKSSDSVSSTGGASTATEAVVSSVSHDGRVLVRKAAESTSHEAHSRAMTRTEVKEHGKGNARSIGGGMPKYTDGDYARLVCLALSDYALCSDEDLKYALVPSVSQTRPEDACECHDTK